MILIATNHNRKLEAWVDHDEFHSDAAPAPPDEKRSYVIAAVAVVIGIIPFIGLLFVQ
jgi:hypothetical protein